MVFISVQKVKFISRRPNALNESPPLRRADGGAVIHCLLWCCWISYPFCYRDSI